MATHGVAQPAVKKRKFFLRDFFKLCRSITRVLPNHKHERKLHIESKRNAEQKSHVPVDQDPFHFKEEKENASLCKVRSYRFEGANVVGSKNPTSLSRSCSQNTNTAAMRSLSFIGRSRSSNRTDSSKFVPTLMRSTTTVQRSLANPNPILYSTSSAKVVKPPPIEKKLRCTLEELCNGCTKKIKIKRDVITSSGQISEEEEMVEIKVEPGWKGGTKVTFEGKGNEILGSVPADLIFVVVEKEHKVFKREGDDLEMVVEVSLLEALTGSELSLALPDGDNLSLKIEDIIHPGYVTVVQGKGMPNPKEKGKKRGDLRVEFRTKFPKQLTDDQRAEVQKILFDSVC